ncbi:hypothetical protein PM082_016831 [Marasmius tenuissimus]|nr:hypothetical protein PM082_016831 [Marasmius tenuissimus]
MFPETPGSFTLQCFHEPPHLERPIEETIVGDGRIRYIFQSESAEASTHGCSRLTVLDHHIRRITLRFCPHEDRLSHYEAWLSQAIHVFNVAGVPKEEWEDCNCFVDLTLFVTNDGQTQHLPRNVDIEFDPPYYLFIIQPPRLPDTTPDVAVWSGAPAESLYYWSADPNGDSRMSDMQCIGLALPCFRPFVDWSPVSWKSEVYDFMRQWQVAKGFDPLTTDFARSMRYPVVDILARDNKYFESCAKDGEDSEHSLGLNLARMEVDECFEINFNSQDAPCPHENFEETTSMDVKLEDFKNLMDESI